MNILRNFPYEMQIAARYTSARRQANRNSFISFISLISVAGIALGVAALIVVLSVMNGFQKEVANRMLSMIAHIEVADQRGGMADWKQVLQLARANPAVRGGAPFVALQGMLVHEDLMAPAGIQGVLPEAEGGVSSVATKMQEGSFNALQAGAFNIILGYELANKLGVKPGDKLTLLVAPQQRAAGSAAGNARASGGEQLGESGLSPRRRLLTVSGLFNVGHNDYDSAAAVMHMADAQEIEGISAPTGLRLSLVDLHQAPRVAQELGASMPAQYLFRDWSRQNEIWFAAVQSQKRMMFLILTLIIAVAAFNLVSTLVMKVNDKQADIAILRTLGSSPLSVMKIFMVQGALVGVMGTACGVAMGVLVALNVDHIMPVVEYLLGGKLLSKDIYFLSSVPSDLQWADVATIAAVSVALSFVATLYPSYAASRVNPAQSLRYE